jgi:hypothetical protein
MNGGGGQCRTLLLRTAHGMQVHPVELWNLLRLPPIQARWGPEIPGHLASQELVVPSAPGRPEQQPIPTDGSRSTISYAQDRDATASIS